ncbi:Neocarzinostatin family protein [Jatrophihabitans endophyticus]|uniref:Neocarzinostatin family protein n=1 Tax=Jatrophihabitans endophyticus TaxID=1206085 RepID=A0A1M5PUN7_9ACTN|nr:enediyne antibiotic chromoprotein [Jatrophihabitans endophyticus]SHH05585.1 Neocarzinostatin family protein [Jatrophihabitans endophyticus]
MPQNISTPVPDGRRRRRTAALGAGVLGLALGGALVAAPSAFAAGTLTVTPSTGLGSTASVTVRGTGFTPNASLYVAECDVTAAAGTACKQASYVVVTTNASGAFGPTTLSVSKTFTGWNGATGTSGATVTCKGAATAHQCAVQTSNTANGAADIATRNITFA